MFSAYVIIADNIQVLNFSFFHPLTIRVFPASKVNFLSTSYVQIRLMDYIMHRAMLKSRQMAETQPRRTQRTFAAGKANIKRVIVIHSIDSISGI